MGNIIEKNNRQLPQPSIIAASSSSFGIVVINPVYKMIENGMLIAIITKIIPGNVLNRCNWSSTQIVGTTAGGIIKPDKKIAPINVLTFPFLRCSIKLAI